MSSTGGADGTFDSQQTRAEARHESRGSARDRDATRCHWKDQGVQKQIISVTAEAVHRSPLLTCLVVCRYTFNDNANLTNSTYINLKERDG